MHITTYLDITDFYPDCLGEKCCGSLGRPSINWKKNLNRKGCTIKIKSQKFLTQIENVVKPVVKAMESNVTMFPVWNQFHLQKRGTKELTDIFD